MPRQQGPSSTARASDGGSKMGMQGLRCRQEDHGQEAPHPDRHRWTAAHRRGPRSRYSRSRWRKEPAQTVPCGAPRAGHPVRCSPSSSISSQMVDMLGNSSRGRRTSQTHHRSRPAITFHDRLRRPAPHGPHIAPTDRRIQTATSIPPFRQTLAPPQKNHQFLAMPLKEYAILAVDIMVNSFVNVA